MSCGAKGLNVYMPMMEGKPCGEKGVVIGEESPLNVMVKYISVRRRGSDLLIVNSWWLLLF